MVLVKFQIVLNYIAVNVFKMVCVFRYTNLSCVSIYSSFSCQLQLHLCFYYEVTLSTMVLDMDPFQHKFALSF